MGSPASRKLAGLRVLVVDDEPFIALALEDYLRDAGAEDVKSATSRRAAEQLAEHANFDAAVLDIALPDGTSFGVARSLSRTGTLIVFHSGNIKDEVRREFPRAQVCLKPVPPDDLIDLLADNIGAPRPSA